MNKLTTMNNTQTMTSREIAEVVEKRHDNVKRTIETLVESSVIQLPQFEEVKNHLGQTVTEYIIDKRTSYIVVAQLSPEFTARLVDRWQELEEQQQKQLPQSHIEAVRAYLTTLEKVEEQQSQIKQQIETISSQVKVIDTKQIVTNEGNEYFTINRIKSLNPDMVFNGNKLTTKSNELDLPTTQLFAPYNMNVPNTYHSKVWNLVYPKAKLP